MDIVGAMARPALISAMTRQRKRLGLTQKRMAKQIGITQGTVSRLEATAGARITEEVADKIKRWLAKAEKVAAPKKLTRVAA